MSRYQIAIQDGAGSFRLDGHHASMDEARDAASRAALSQLLNGQSQESLRVAYCDVVEQPSGRRIQFKVTLELTDYI